MPLPTTTLSTDPLRIPKVPFNPSSSPSTQEQQQQQSDAEAIATFRDLYPDYDERDEEFPLWIEGVDTTYAPFIPTSTRRVLLALEKVNIQPTDRVLDVGSGDGRFCVAATRFFGADFALGIEFEQDLVEKSTSLSQEFLGEYFSKKRVDFQQADLTKWRDMDLMVKQTWNVVIVFLSPEGGTDLEGWLLDQVEKGARVVAMVFDLNHLKGLQCSYEDRQEGIWIYEKMDG